jgi:ADP-heptose:LPS heptosyltransferase
VTFHRTRNLDLAELVGLTVDPEPGGVKLDDAYAAELADRGRRPRLDYIREFLGISEPPARPTVRIPAENRSWAAARAGEVGKPLVLLFPQVGWVPRGWPASHWVDLAWDLHAVGVPAVVLLADKDDRFTNTPAFWWGTPVGRLAALMESAALVVGADSFPAHLAGAVGVPTLALLGPTRPTVFAHAPAVIPLASDRIDCTGCHFGEPFRAACDQGCQSLGRLYPADVLGRVRQVIGA